MVSAASLAIAGTVGATKPETRNRAEIPASYQWDFSAIFPDWAAWEAALREMEARMGVFASLKGTLAQGPAAVLGAYQQYDEIGMLRHKVFRFAQLQRDVDLRNQEVAGNFQRVSAILAKFGTATAWFAPEMLTIPRATMEDWLESRPALAPYRFGILELYRRQAHVLDEKGEHLLSLARRFSQTPAQIFQELSTSDIKFPRVALSDGRELTLSPGVYQSVLRTNHRQADRATAFAAFLGTYAATANTYAAIYHGVMLRGWFSAQARNYPTTLAAALDRDAIPVAVVETLVATARAGAEPLRRYARLRQRLLGLASYHLYDGSLPIYRSAHTYPYEEAKALVLDSIAPLGEDYRAKFRRFVTGGRIDVYENEGKRSGAYSAGVYGVGPYLLLNYNDTLDAVFTFAHEAGHALHTVLSYETQPYATADYTIFVAEVASTVNERLLLDRLLATTEDPTERFLLLQHAVDSIVSTFYTQVLFADFELRAHRLVEEGRPVTAAVLNDLYANRLREYYGDAVVLDELYKHTWARVPHFFNAPYYVYQYATCFASSAKLFRDMTTGSAAARRAATERYLTLLRSGGDDHPMRQLQKAGVDLTQSETVQAIVERMDELVTQLEAEAAKIQPGAVSRR